MLYYEKRWNERGELKKMGETLKLGCVVLAAGSARRFGGNKLTAALSGKSLIQRALEAVPTEVVDAAAVVT